MWQEYCWNIWTEAQISMQNPTKGENMKRWTPKAESTVPRIQHSELAVESNALVAGSFKSVYKARWVKKGRNVALLVLHHSNQAALSDMENEIRMFGTLGRTSI